MNLYEKPEIYDVFYNPANEAPLRNHYEMLFKDKPIHRILDCSFGSGNLSFVLKEMGYDLTGSDLSKEMLEAAKEKAKRRGLTLPLVQADFCALNTIAETFDLVMSTGNSLPHVSLDHVNKAILSMKDRIEPKGYIYIDLRNWDKILSDETRYQYYPPVIKDDLRVNVVLFKEFIESKIQFNFLYAYEKENKILKVEEAQVSYYPLLKHQLVELLSSNGFINIEIYPFIQHQIKTFEEMNWYVVMAQKGEL
ncbi:MAG: class I SAM-dependent methyltransferase [Clostridia bacterium]|nr:class I SAM-dependent methyltransferase [Clostridia bacterium]